MPLFEIRGTETLEYTSWIRAQNELDARITFESLEVDKLEEQISDSFDFSIDEIEEIEGEEPKWLQPRILDANEMLGEE